ncbi:E3 ubiquitin-protein ligase HECTD3-like isoform X2 [Excalfactoria chinensis]|uniref:E3 ubiquitin-protein ligase HECTD3-like isoform X2 n=1 Tax=Excalfactoria chinensis TaxID=46218 RepID=UPI003B3BD7F7
MRTGEEATHQVLGRLRFLLQCSECFRRSRPLPAALCYVPREVQYKICKDPSAAASSRSLFSVWDSPGPARGSKRATIELQKGGCLRATGEEYRNSEGLWVKLRKEHLEEYGVCHELEEGWVLAQRFGEWGDKLVPVDLVERIQQQPQTFGMDYKPVASWEQVVDLMYSMQLGLKPVPVEPDEAVVQKLRSVPPNWSYEKDMELGHFLYDFTNRDQHCKDCVKEHLNSIEVSSQLDDFKVSHLTDNQADTYWESNGSPGQHWVRLHMKKCSVIKKLWLVLDSNINSYIPRRVAVYGGPANRLQHLRTVLINENSYRDVCILRDMKTHMPVLEIRILECRELGYNVRLRGIKFKSFLEADLNLNADMFQRAQLVRYPLLEGVDADVLYRRAIVIQRFAQLLDSVLGYVIPITDEIDSAFSVLRSSESSPPCLLPKLLINRQLAREHRAHPELDPSGQNTVFIQVYENLQPSKTNNCLLDYRWPQTHSQWWECVFTTEGVIDSGGGFRDCLTDISEELCPSSGDVPVPLPFFVRTSNQGNSSSDTRDMYVPNPSCKDFPKYEWIGQLMGAALRSKEILVLALPSLVWKQLSGEEIIWSKDFAAVDVELVKLLQMLEEVDREAFDFMFGKELTYTTVRSDQRMVELIPKGSSTVVRFEDRKEFIRLVQKARLEESKEQVAAIRAGLLRVVPQAVLDLLTWQQLERKVCGIPEVTVDELKKYITFEDFESYRVQQFWDALKNFTSEDLSRFLKFVTGRSRLPVQLTIYPDRSLPERLDMMPEASTCSCTMYLPKYSSVKMCEELLRFAVYNCMSIDTDKDNWD